MTTLSDPSAVPPRRAAHLLARAEAGLCAANRWVLIMLLAAMAVLVIGSVFARYVLGRSFPWVEELTRYLMIWSTFLGAGLALRVGGHIAIDSLAAALPPPAARVVRALIVAVMAGGLLAMVWLGWDYADFAWYQESPVLGWSLGQIYLALPVGALLMLLHLALVARHWVRHGQWERVPGFDPQAL